jgi:hypothetical protein
MESIQNNSPNVQVIPTNIERTIFAKTNTNVTWTYEDDTVTVTMTTGQVSVGEWRGIGFSLDQNMV